MLYYYSIYNLIVQSQLMLPFLPTTPLAPSISHLTIEYGSVHKDGLSHPIKQGLTYQANSTDFWLNVPSVARFLVSEGQHIIIDPIQGIDEDSIRTFLLGVCFEVLLRQRDITVIPGYTLKVENGGVAFAGSANVGQSILQGLFYKRGYSFCNGTFFAFNDEGLILPGDARLEFWHQSAKALEFEFASLKELRPGIRKYIVPLKRQYCHTPLPLRIIYTLKMHQQPEIIFSSIENANKKNHLQQLSATNNLSIDLWPKAIIQTDQKLLNDIEVVCIHLPNSGIKLQEVITTIEHDFTKRGYHVHS